MNFSTDLPTSLKAYDRLPGKSGYKLVINVSPEADAAFLSDCRRADPPRFKQLEKAMLTERFRQERTKRFCANETGGQHPLPDDTRKDTLYCDDSCKKSAYRRRKAGLETEQPAKPAKSSLGPPKRGGQTPRFTRDF